MGRLQRDIPVKGCVPEADVFISYETESGLALVRDIIAPAIEAANFTCWYAKRNSKHGPFPRNITQAIKKCRVFLLILDRNVFYSEHVKSETALAYERYDRHEEITLLPFRVDTCKIEDDDDFHYYLIRQQIVDGCPTDKESVQNLIDIISEILLAYS